MTKSKTLLLLVAVIAVTVVLLQSSSLLSLDSLKQYSEQLQSFYHASPLTTTVVFFSVYVLAVALSIPAASLLTLLAGFLFPFLVGLAVVSFASTIGCSLAFLFSRYFFRDWIQQRFKQSYERIDREFEKQGTEYLLALRLVPLFPFFVINAVMGLTRISLPRYFIVSQLGMLPGTAVYVYAGQQLGNIRSMSDILTPGLWFSFLLLGMLPLLSRKLLAVYRNHRILSVFKRPAGFDYQVAVIGAGAAGLVAANIASKLKATVLLVEQDKMGGDCLNTGCVPSKVLLKVAHDVSLARQYGADQPVDINSLKAAINKAIKTIEPHDSVERYTSLGVDCEKGKALVTSPWELEIAGKKVSAKRIVIATGAKPAIPDIPGLQQVPYLTSETIWSINRLPGSMVVIGGGAMGCEMAQAFSLLGVEVTLLQRNQYLLPSEDPVFSKMIQQCLEQQGVNIICSVSDLFMEVNDGQAFARFTESTGGIDRKLPLDICLLACGRRANTDELDLEKLGVEFDSERIVVDDFLRTRVPTVLAAGDVCSSRQFTHVAGHQGAIAGINAVLRGLWSLNAARQIEALALFTDPGYARAGMTEKQLQQSGQAFELTELDYNDIDRAITEGQQGMIRVFTASGTDRILGVAVFGSQAPELVQQFLYFMQQGKGLKKVLSQQFLYPVWSAAIQKLASQWYSNQDSHTADKALALFHRLRS